MHYAFTRYKKETRLATGFSMGAAGRGSGLPILSAEGSTPSASIF